MRFYVRAMKREWHRRSVWFTSVQPTELRKVLSRIRSRGPLTIRDIDDDVLVEKDHEWASRKPSKRALQLAFYRGVLTVSRREGMLKTYELMTRHFGWDRLPQAASEREGQNHLLDRALRSQGIVSLDSICHLAAPRKAAIARLIAGRVRRKELVPIALEGSRFEHWVRPETLDATLDPNGTVHILNPFDPLVIQRKRLAGFFGYEHRFEAYVPKPKRLFGYFSQPVLVGDEIVAVIDLKTDRERGKCCCRSGSGCKKVRAACSGGRSRKRCTASNDFSSPADAERVSAFARRHRRPDRARPCATARRRHRQALPERTARAPASP
jgi:uncharacterized protein YcaQ